MNLKLKSGNLTQRKRNDKWPQGSVIEINQDLENKGVSVETGGLALYLVVCLFEIYPFLNRCLSNQSLSEALALHKREKTTVRAHKRETTFPLVRTMLHDSPPPKAPPLSHGSHSWPMTSLWPPGTPSLPKTGPREAWVPARSR